MDERRRIKALEECTAEHGFSPLHIAARHGRDDEVRALVAAGADVCEYSACFAEDSGWQGGWGPVHCAAYGGHAETVKLLVMELGAALIHRGGEHLEYDITHIAVLRGHVGVLRAALIDMSLNVCGKDDEGRTPAHIAAMTDQPEMLRALTEAAADNFAKDLCKDFDDEQKQGIRSFMHGKIKGRVVRARCRRGATPLAVAAAVGAWGAFKELLAMGADVKKAANPPEALMTTAAFGGSLDIVRLLVTKYKMDPSLPSINLTDAILPRTVKEAPSPDALATGVHISDSRRGVEKALLCAEPPIIFAARGMHTKIVRVLIDTFGVDVNAAGANGTAMVEASVREDFETMVVLVQRAALCGVTLDLEGKPRSPLIASVRALRVESIKGLLELGPDLDGVDGEGRTAADYATLQFFGNILEMLLKRGAASRIPNVGRKFTHGHGYLLYIGLMNKTMASDVYRHLIDLGADVNSREHGGELPLSDIFTYIMDLGLVRLLLAEGADPNAASADGSTPTHALCRAFLKAHGDGFSTTVRLNSVKKFIAMFDLMRERGADFHRANAAGVTPLSLLGPHAREVALGTEGAAERFEARVVAGAGQPSSWNMNIEDMLENETDEEVAPQQGRGRGRGRGRVEGRGRGRGRGQANSGGGRGRGDGRGRGRGGGGRGGNRGRGQRGGGGGEANPF